MIASEMGTRNFIFESAIAILQLEGSTSAAFKRNIALQPKLRNSTITIFLKSATSNPQLECSTSAIFGKFLAVESGRFMKKKLEVKNLVQMSLSGKFLFSRETDSSKNIFGRFLKPS